MSNPGLHHVQSSSPEFQRGPLLLSVDSFSLSFLRNPSNSPSPGLSRPPGLNID